MHSISILSSRIHVIPIIILLFAHSLAANMSWRDGDWQFTVGARWGETHRMSLQSAPTFDEFEGDFQPIAGTIPASVGDSERVADRSYTNGFVGISRVGGTPITTEETPLTTYWGYDSNDQVAGGALSFTAYSSQAAAVGSESASYGTISHSEDRQTGFVPVLELSRLWSTGDGRHDIGFTVGLSWFSASRSTPMQHTFDYVQEIVYSRSVLTDYYDLGGVVPPRAPYEGPVAPPGPVIANLPTERVWEEEIMGTEQHRYSGVTGIDARLRSQRLNLGGTWSLYGKQAAKARSLPASQLERGFVFRFEALTFDAGVVINRTDFALTEVNEVYPLSGDGTPSDEYAFADRKRTRVVKVKVGSYASVGAKFALNKAYTRSFGVRLRYEDGGTSIVQSDTTRARAESRGWSVLSAFGLEF